MSLDLRTGLPVWLINRKQIAGHRKLAKDIRCEVAVVGGGVSGALIAHRLVNLGRQVIIVDRRDVGMGSTMASTAILSYEPDVHLLLSDHFKSGQRLSPQNRPTGLAVWD
jgi:NADPH-dependent 2,4-dienoyl-CoA reductase/sulfur reductase-like enzyme